MRISDWSSDVCSSDLTRRMMSASDYGIVGDGIADDTAALQAALDAITTDGGTFVDIPPGVYRISATLRLTFIHDSAAHVGLLSHGATLKSAITDGSPVLEIESQAVENGRAHV